MPRRRSPSRKPWSLAVALVACVSLGAPSVEAQTKVELAAARQWFKEGEKAEKSGDCATAIERFEKAQAVKATPQIELRIGVCEEKLGLLAQALSSYETALTEAREASLKRVESVAEEQIRAIERRVPRLSVTLREPYEGVEVTLDADVLSVGPKGLERPMNPGTHVLAAEAPGKKPFEVSFGLGEGESRSIVIALDPLAPASAPAAPIESRSKAPAFALIAGGGAAIAGGVVLFAFALGKDGDIDDRCGGADRQRCPESQRDAIEADVTSVDTMQAIGFATFGVGVIAASIGGVMLATRPSDDEAARAASKATRVAPVMTSRGGGLVVTGRF